MSLLPMAGPYAYGGLQIDPRTGMPVQPPGVMDRIGGLLGGSNSYGGLLGEQDQKAAQRQGLMALGSQLMAGSGPSPVKQSFGSILGPAIMSGMQAQNSAGKDMLEAMLLKTQIAKANKPSGAPPSAVAEYEYAKSNGYAGSFEEWKRVSSAQPSSPAGIQEYEYFSKLTPDQQKQFLSLQRSPVVPQLSIVNGVPTLVDKTDGTLSPLSTIDSEIDAASRKKDAEARGAATGEAWGAMAKKGINALNVLETIDLAEPLIDVSTGSGAGAATDKVASFFGKSLAGDQAIAQLKIVQANLMTNMPRMEGPQSDRDVQLYREAAGELGDPTVPRARKRAALNMIRSLQERYAEQGDNAQGGGSQPKKRFNPQTGKIE